MDKLPRELYRLIIQRLEKKADIAHLLCCSKTFQRECESILYATVIINGGAPQQLFDLTRNPRTASLITSLSFIPTRNYSLTDVRGRHNRGTDASSKGLLRLALEALTNLKSLKLRDWFSPLSPLIRSLLDDVPFKLHTFTCPYAWDADLIRFLSGQDELRTLEWRGSIFSNSIKTPTIPPNILPNLTNVHIASNVLVHLVPGRPISRVHHNSLRSSVASFPLLLAQSSKRVEALVCGLLTTDHGELENWNRHLSDLRFLECVIVRANQSSLYAILPSLTKLTKLVLCSMGGRDFLTDDLSTNESYQLVAKAFELAPSLCVVEREVVPPPDSEEHLVFLHWKRGEGGPSPRPTPQNLDEWLYY